MSGGVRLGWIAIALSAGALGVSGYGVWGGSRDPPHPEAEFGTQERLEELESSVASLRRQAIGAGMRRLGGVSPLEPNRDDPFEVEGAAGSTGGAPARPEPPAPAEPIYAQIHVRQGGVSVTQEPNGAFSVTNSDASQTGEVITVTGVMDDGTEQDVRIVLPAPE